MKVAEYINGIKNQDIAILSKAITLVESNKEEHQDLARELIATIPKNQKSKRIGISGTPGVGKSTFINAFGTFLTSKNFKVAVLTIDPTSHITGGSILGDKTRMFDLSNDSNAFIRPSPSGNGLGGVNSQTRESILLCEAFGFDYIIVETVGVGQSEVSVSKMVDFFVLLMQPGSGDDLQGIKRGIMELAQLVLVNKADGDLKALANISQHEYQNAVDILRKNNSWKVSVELCSSIEKTGFENVFTKSEDFFKTQDISKIRLEQKKQWLWDLFYLELKRKFENDNKLKQKLDELILKDSVHQAVKELIDSI